MRHWLPNATSKPLRLEGSAHICRISSHVVLYTTLSPAQVPLFVLPFVIVCFRRTESKQSKNTSGVYWPLHRTVRLLSFAGTLLILENIQAFLKATSLPTRGLVFHLTWSMLFSTQHVHIPVDSLKPSTGLHMCLSLLNLTQRAIVRTTNLTFSGSPFLSKVLIFQTHPYDPISSPQSGLIKAKYFTRWTYQR